jgi:hypothetical protein
MLTSPGLPSPMWLAELLKFSASPLLCRTPDRYPQNHERQLSLE